MRGVHSRQGWRVRASANGTTAGRLGRDGTGKRATRLTLMKYWMLASVLKTVQLMFTISSILIMHIRPIFLPKLQRSWVTREDAEAYQMLYNEVLDRFEYVTQAGLLVSKTQTGCVLALHLNLVEVKKIGSGCLKPY
jgi:hypothetical protein